MIESRGLLSTLQRQLGHLLGDLRSRVADEPSVGDPLRAEYQRAFDAERTGWTFTEWAEDRLTQVAVGWVLGCVFVRFCEDNGLLPDARLGGVSARGDEARASQQDYFTSHPNHSDRDYLHDVFRAAAAAPGLAGVLGEGTNPLWLTDPSADACSELIRLFRATGDDGALTLDFTDPARDTRFLGDLYQDLSEHAKKTYALLQTPVFVEEFILDRTLDPAIESFGLAGVSIIDPTCGSGHFLLGAFDRLWQRWCDAEPATDARVLAQRALEQVWGVDLNPFAAAIARFRLLVSALAKCRIRSLVDAPDFAIHVAVGDSLLWGARYHVSLPGLEGSGGDDHQFLYATEDADALRKTFQRSYAAVVGNPPYIVPKDKAANEAYRRLYGSCSGKYSLGVPFTELFFELAQATASETARPAGFVGMITANSFMKREMGKKLIREYLPTWDLTHVVDTSGAYIPGHGTPTVILLGRNQPPVTESIRSVLGIRGEPSTPPDPTKGLVWSAIVGQIDHPGSESDYVSVIDTERSRFAKHPWSIGGGGAAELKEELDARGAALAHVVDSIGITSFTLEDDVFLQPASALRTRRALHARPMVEGEFLRDFGLQPGNLAVFPYDEDYTPTDPEGAELRLMWPFRTNLSNNKMFGAKSKVEAGLHWFEFGRLTVSKLRRPLSIAFAFVATHNHFVLDRGGKVFNRSAPVIKLPEGATLDEHLGLLGLLNSSVACFWMQQVMTGKHKGDGGEAHADPAGQRFEFDGTKLQEYPLPEGDRPVERTRRLDGLAASLASHQPAALAADGAPSGIRLDAARAEANRAFAAMITAQEELDWHCLHLYGLTDEPLAVPDGQEAPPLALGERAFEIELARRVAAGETETAWFTRHRSTPITDLPAHWPDWYRKLVERRIELIETDRNVGLVERPEHKRRWARTPWEDLEAAAVRDWLLDKLEDRSLWFNGAHAECRSLAQLADRAAAHPEWGADWMDVARLWTGDAQVDPLAVVTKLVTDEHVPTQATARYKESGLAKRAEWERVWDLQRAEDRGEDVGRIPVPPKYGQGDFAKASYWKHRGKLDVPKERFTSVPGAEKDAASGDGTMVLAWAGFDHAQLAQALATLLFARQTADGWSGEQLVPILAALDEVVPWVEQWHPDVDPAIGQTLGAFYRGQVDQSLGAIGATRDTLAAWRPPAPTRGRRAKTT